VAHEYESNPTRHTIQANASMMMRTSISKKEDQEPEETSLVAHVVMHNLTKSNNRQIDVNDKVEYVVAK